MDKEIENENEVIQIEYEEIRTIPDKTLATIFVIAGAIAMIVSPFIISGLFGWALSLTGLIFVILGICGFVYASDDSKRAAKKA